MGGRRRVTKGFRLRGLARLAAGGVQTYVGYAGLASGSVPGRVGGAFFAAAGARDVVRGSRRAFARTGRGTGSGGGQRGHPFYGNQYVKVGRTGRKAKRVRG